VKRRTFIAGLGMGVAWPLAARAQQGAMLVIGILYPSSRDLTEERLAALRQGLSDSGFVEGRNVAIEYRWADDQYDRFPAMAADLVRRQVSVIHAAGIPAVMAARAATTTIPIIFSGGFDPVAAGFVASLNQPGGNLTGVTALGVELVPKRLELLHELVPKSTVVALLVNPANPSSETTLKNAQAASHTLGLQLRVLHASNERDLAVIMHEVTRF
jgi:putative tryptophan/tyrosine transport system substrate-binding protein